MKLKSKLSSKIVVVALLVGCLVGWSARADAPAAWATNCAACHGKDGKGSTMMGRRLSIKDLTDPKVQASFTDADAANDIKNGITEGGTTKMKAFGDKLSDDDIKALVAYVRTLK
ncbi:MAG: cytochrome c [Methylacidiphilales bacterium]|nr:cytochrome c [Candidatus Methylacidiphilales bacterium]